MSVAVVTAFAPNTISFVGKLNSVLDRVGLDKGPLLMFGVLSTALGFALSRLEASGREGAAQLAADQAAANASGIELQTELLGSVQAELGGIREEVAVARREAKEANASSDDSQDQATDPLFRLAASLDQLGAQIDKRVDKARREQMDAINGLAKLVEVSAQQRESSFEHSSKELEAIRMDVADLRAQLVRVAAQLSAAPGPPAPASAQQESDRETCEAVEGESEENAAAPAPSAPTLPRELSEDAPQPNPPAPIPSAPDAEQDQAGDEPSYHGFSHEDDTESASKGSPQDASKLGVSMKSLGFSEPPAPMPSEDLGLIDQMDEDTARQVDQTPPLFPDV